MNELIMLLDWVKMFKKYFCQQAAIAKFFSQKIEVVDSHLT